MKRPGKLLYPRTLIVTSALSIAAIAGEGTGSPPGQSHIQFGDRRVYIQAVERETSFNPHSVWQKLEQTCKFWTRRYKTSPTELARVNMNISCREAAEFAKSELNREIKANYAAANPGSAAQGGGAVLLNAESAVAGAESGSARCKSLARQKKSIAKLRKGYKIEQGNRLRERRREIEKRMHEQC